ncbi:MAG: type VI secretion system contractile sheath small subunit [Alphaproteobacteria bacterium]
MAESIQHKLDRVRPPRVQITYDVEVGNAIELRELPFVMGIMADLSGDRDPDVEMKIMRDRKFIEIDRDNFDGIMSDIKPRLAFRVDNKLVPTPAADAQPAKAGADADADTQLNVLLNFKSMEDFEPINVLQQVDPLAKLFDARTKLHNLLAKLDGNDKLEKLLQNILENADSRANVQKDIAAAKPAADAKPAKPTK